MLLISTVYVTANVLGIIQHVLKYVVLDLSTVPGPPPPPPAMKPEPSLVDKKKLYKGDLQ